MGFDDYFEHKSKYRRYDYYHDRGHDSRREYPDMHSLRHGRENYGLYFVNKIWNNRKLRLLFIVIVLFIGLVIIISLIAIVPLIIRIIDYVNQTGIKGLTDTVTGFAEKLWNGSGN
jgi:hypothetical protein